MRRSLLLVLALFPAFSLPAQPLWAEAPTSTTETTNTVAAPYITVTTAETRTLRDVVIATGMIGAVEQVQVAPLVEGQPIEALLADVGDKVEAGQVLARLSTSSLALQKSQLTASLASARAAISQAQAQADETARVAARTEALLKQGTSSQANADKANAAAISATQALEAARANLALVEAQLANVDLMLSRTEVKAPVAGEITSRTAQVGAIASAAQPMFSMIRDNALELRADVAEGDVVRLAQGQTATLHLAGVATPETGTVRLVEPAIDATTRMGRVRISIDATGALRVGMFAEAEVLVAEHKTLSVPVTAVGMSDQGPSVLKVSDGVARRVQVTTGIREAGWVEILSGLSEGDSVVAKAGAFVRDGDRITPVPAKTN